MTTATAGQSASPAKKVYPYELAERLRRRFKRIGGLSLLGRPKRLGRYFSEYLDEMREWRKYAALAHQIGAPTPMQQFRDQQKMWSRYNLSPSDYYKLGLWTQPPENLPLYVSFNEQVSLMKLINGPEIMGKETYAELCKKLNLPCVPTIALFDNGKVTGISGSTELPSEDLFVKYTKGSNGRGAERWNFVSQDRYQSTEGPTLSRDGLFDMLIKRSVEETTLVQPALTNHPDMAPFSPGGICTLRVVTASLRGAAPEALFAVLRMPTGKCVVDNFVAGGICSPMDLETGKLGLAPSRNEWGKLLTHHSDTGHRIEGQIYPHFKEALALCCRAQQAIGRFTSLGWDLAYTTQGFILIETNQGWDADLVQLAHRQPILKLGFYAEWVDSELARIDAAR